MRSAVMCWAPECGELVPQPARGRGVRYCNVNCRMKAIRRNGGKAPTEPFPPLLPAAPVAITVVAYSENPVPPVSRPTSVPHADGPTAGGAGGGAAAPPPPPAKAPAPAEPMISLADHLAKVAEVANPPAPEPPPEHPLVAKFRQDLVALGQEGSRDGLQVLQLAEKLVSSATSPAASAGLSRELKALMEGLEQNTPAALAERDPSLIIRERTLAKLRGLDKVAHDNVA